VQRLHALLAAADPELVRAATLALVHSLPAAAGDFFAQMPDLQPQLATYHMTQRGRLPPPPPAGAAAGDWVCGFAARCLEHAALRSPEACSAALAGPARLDAGIAADLLAYAVCTLATCAAGSVFVRCWD
jgi:hypothetical protein